jgi:peptidyl-prolyl cis-trans isomerase SurA
MRQWINPRICGKKEGMQASLSATTRLCRRIGHPIIALAALASLGLGASLAAATARAALLDRLEASVNASLILLSDVRKFRETEKLRQQLDPLFAGTSIASKGKDASNGEIVSFLIDEKIILQQFPVADAEVETEINSIQSNNRISREQLKSALAEQRFAFEDYFELIRSSASKRNLIDRDIRTKVTISDDDVKNYFYNHYAKSASAPSAYKLSMITVSTRNYKSPAAAKAVAQRALADIKAGESFEEVAKRASDGPTASNGGDLGVVSDDQVSPQIREQVKKLKIGEVSDVFGSPQAGFNILKLLDVQTADDTRMDKMKEEIRGQLTAAEYQHQIQLWLERMRQTAFIHRAGESSIAGLPRSASR